MCSRSRVRWRAPARGSGTCSPPELLLYRADPLRAKTCRCSRCATCTGRMRLDDGLSWAQDLNDAWFAAASLAPRPFASCDPHNLNPSRTLIAPARHARHILAHTSSQTMSHRDLSLRSSRRLVPSAAIAWSRAWRPCATPNMTVPSSRWSPDRSSFCNCIVIFAASRTLAVRFQCSGAPQASSSCLVCTRHTCSAAVLAVQPIRPAWCEGKFCSQRIRPVPFQKGNPWRDTPNPWRDTSGSGQPLRRHVV